MVSEHKSTSSKGLLTAKKAAAPPRVLTVDELASLLRVNRDTAYKAIAEGQIPGVQRIGKAIRISRDAVINWLGGEGHVPRSDKEKT